MSVSVYISATVCRYASLLSASSSVVRESRSACVLRWAAFHHRSRASPRSASSTMKPCSASWRRWYDVAPVLSRSCRASWVAVAGPSSRSSISILSRVGWERARRPAADGVIADVAISAGYLCKHCCAKVSVENGPTSGTRAAGYVEEMTTDSASASRSRAFERDTDYIPDRITLEEGRSQDPFEKPLETPTWPAIPGRYRLIAAKACPWATRSIIVRQLLGLEDVISLGLAAPTHDERSWSFGLDPAGRDPVLGIERLQEAFHNRDPGYSKGITVPAMVDVAENAVVTNDFPWITHDLFFEWRDHRRPDAPCLWPDDVREEMEDVMERV